VLLPGGGESFGEVRAFERSVFGAIEAFKGQGILVRATELRAKVAMSSGVRSCVRDGELRMENYLSTSRLRDRV